MMDRPIVTALAHIQAALKAPKEQYNSFGKYHYRKCEDILNAVKPLLAKEGLVLTLSDELEIIGERYYIKATAMVRNATNDTLSCEAYAREADTKAGMDLAQITGSASSYARKYALNGLFCIDDTDDPDVTSAGPMPQGKRLSVEGYRNTVAAYAEGRKTEQGEDIRNWFANYTNATPEMMIQFDKDVDTYRASHI